MSKEITHHNAGYRQGVVLGLTMAEVLLLLVFILLLITGGMIERFRQNESAQKQQIAELEEQLKAAAALTKELEKFKDIEATPEDVKRAVAIVENLRQSLGTDPKAMIETIQSLTKQLKAGTPEIPPDWQKLVKVATAVDQHGGIDQLVRAEEQLRELTELLTKKGYPVDKSTPLSVVVRNNVRNAGQGRKQEWPPMIRLSEADGYFFPLGKAELSSKFETDLRTKIIPKLLEITSQYDVDVIEVIGHTDQVPMNGQPSTLDDDLRGALLGTVRVDELVSGDNAGLGIARAVAVAKVLLNDSHFKNIRILPLSGAQLTTVDEWPDTDPKGAASVKERRRIEIRLRRHTVAQYRP